MKMPGAKTIYVVDDEILVRRRLARRLVELGYDAQSFASAEAFLEDADLDRPCCVVLDVHMPGFSGFDAFSLLRSRQIETPVIFMTGHGDIAMGVRAMKMGAVDFLTKPVSMADLLPSIALALAQSDASHVAQQRHRCARDRFDRLTPREQEVLTLVLAGQRNKQIAVSLASREATVKVHRSRLMRKLEMRTLAELQQFGREFHPQSGHDDVKSPLVFIPGQPQRNVAAQGQSAARQAESAQLHITRLERRASTPGAPPVRSLQRA